METEKNLIPCSSLHGPTVMQKNEIIRSSFAMSLPEFRVISCALSKLHKFSKPEDGITITLDDMTATCLNKNGAYKSMASSVDSILKRQVVLRTGPDKTRKIQWVSIADYDAKKKEIKLFFTPLIFPMLINMQGCFTKYKLEKLKYFSSATAFRLFQIWTSGKNYPKDYILPVEELRDMLDLGDQYAKYADFKSKVLKPAIKQCANAGLEVDVLEIKEGRSVQKLAFKITEITEKSIEKIVEGKKEITLTAAQSRAYAEKLIGPSAKAQSYFVRALRTKGFSSYGCASNEQEIALLSSWLRNKCNAGKVVDLLEAVGFRTRNRKAK